MSGKSRVVVRRGAGWIPLDGRHAHDPRMHAETARGGSTNAWPVPDTHAIPHDGDIVVTYEAQTAIRYTVRRHPGTAQFRVAARDEAVRFACEFAHRHAVDVWSSDDGRYRLIEAYRPRASIA